MESHFETFRKNIVGNDIHFDTPYGRKKLIYADWIASGRLYGPIEDRMRNEIMPYCANTHTETTLSGTIMTRAYFDAKEYIKEQLNASKDDMLVFAGSGMTGAICKLQRIMGLRIPERLSQYVKKRKTVLGKALDNFETQETDRPVVFITHMEHHSNHTTWIETIADCVMINETHDGLVDLNHFKELLATYKNRKLKIASVTACSNVTGIETPYHEMAKLIHGAGGSIWVDFACSGPYVKIDMHPEEEGAHLDAVFVSPHKFLGGPGTPGVMVFHKNFYKNEVPDIPGGGTVYYTNPWNDHKYVQDIESREDGGTPPFLQGIKAALAFKLKEEMGVKAIREREHNLVQRALDSMEKIDGLHVLASQHKNRLGAISFYIDDMHFNLVVKLLNDHYGIQMRGGCACAGTYGHCLLNIDKDTSYKILDRIEAGHIDERPGWVRMSVHPTMSDEDLQTITDALKYIADNKKELAKDYTYDPNKNIFTHNSGDGDLFEENVLRGFYSDLTELENAI
jgi:selenocysteine lyase/cysteine desulfurase